MSMPGLASYEKEMRSAGLVVIGVVSDSKKKAVQKVLDKAKVEFSTVNGAKLPDVNIKAFPTYTVYDRNGQIVYEQVGAGPNEDAIKTAVTKALGELGTALIVDPADYTEKDIARLAKRASKGTSLGRLLGQLEEKIENGSPAEQKEARKLEKTVVTYGEKMLETALASEQKAPHLYYDLCKDLARRFRGHDIGEQADKIYKPLKKDRQARKEIDASRLYQELTSATGKDRDKILKKIKRKYANTRFGQQALAEAEKEEG